MKIKKFNEAVEGSPIKVRVKHLIEYLSKFDPEATVGLDHDGWFVYGYEPKDEVDLIDKRGIFDYWEERNHLTINN